MSKYELMLIRVVKKRMDRGEALEDILMSYTEMSEGARKRVREYVGNY